MSFVGSESRLIEMKEKNHFFSQIIIVIISIALLLITIVLPTLLLQRKEKKILSYCVFEEQENLLAESIPLTFEQKMILLLQSEDKVKLETGESYSKEEALSYIENELGKIPFISEYEMNGQLEAEAQLYLYNFQSNIFWVWSYTDEKIKISGILDEQSGKNMEISIAPWDMGEMPDLEVEQCAKEWGSYLGLSYREIRKSAISSIAKKQEDSYSYPHDSYIIFYNFPEQQSIITFHLQLLEGSLSLSLSNIVM